MKDRQRHFVRNANDKKDGTRFSLVQAFKCAGSGLGYIFATQRNIKIQTGVAILALILGFVLSIPFSSWLAIIVCITVVFAAECINTAIESVVDLVSPDYAELAKRAKDCAAAGVLICALSSLIVAFFVYGQAFLVYLGVGSLF